MKIRFDRMYWVCQPLIRWQRNGFRIKVSAFPHEWNVWFRNGRVRFYHYDDRRGL